MKKTISFVLVLALGLMVCSARLAGAAPLGTAFMYQNLLIDGNDVLDGSYDLMVSLFDDPNEGELRGTVFADDLDVNDGWFEIMLDFGPEAFDGSDLWLEFAIRPGEMDDPNAYVTLWPRYPILPAPYALYSINTGPIHSLDAEDGYPTEAVYVDRSGEVGIGTKRPSAELDVDGEVRIRGGSPGSGKVLTSNASGLASWQTLPAGGDITAVNVGTGLSGGGTSGSVTLAFSTSWGDSRYLNEGQSNSITSAMIVSDTIRAPDIAANGVGASEIADGAVRNSELANDAVTSAKIQNGTIQQADLAFTPGDITAVNTGIGLSGGGTSGNVNLNINVPLTLSGSSSSWIIRATNSGSGYGVCGVSNSSSGYGVYGLSNNGKGVYGYSSSGHGVKGQGVTGVSGYSTSSSGYGVYGTSNNVGVYGYSNSGTGVYGRSVSSYAGYFQGKVHIAGNLSKGGGSFKIDHPLDPENKFLQHSFVESPDMMNIYNGNVTLDENGRATVRVPDYFEALNREFRYQLTCIGGFAPVYIAEKISENHFKIAGGKPGMEISWQVTGIRHDPYAVANRIAVEEVKPAEERGYYLHPKAYGLPEEKGTETVRNPQPSPQIRKLAKK